MLEAFSKGTTIVVLATTALRMTSFHLQMLLQLGIASHVEHEK